MARAVLAVIATVLSVKCSAAYPTNKFRTDETCGMPVIQPSTAGRTSVTADFLQRIIGGTEATPHSWPWQVAMVDQFPSSDLIFGCGGSIISDQWILTAAHCCDPFRTNSISVIVGAHDYAEVAQDSNLFYRITDFVIHPNYTEELDYSVTNDFCLMKTNRTITFNSNIQPICLPQSSAEWPAAGTECITSGWGSINFVGNQAVLQTKLMQTNTKIMDRTACGKFYPNINTESTDRMCAMLPGKGPCTGDSGGPLVCKRDDNKWDLVGVTSYVPKSGCGHPILPSVYGRVADALTWIETTMSTR